MNAAIEKPISRNYFAQVYAGWTAFWFTPTSPIGLHVVRFLAGLLFLFWIAPLAADYRSFFGLDGWFDRAAYIEAQQLATQPGYLVPNPIGWSLIFPLTELFGESAVDIFFYGSMVVLVLFTLGVAARLTSVLTWLIVVSHTANPAIHYDGDYLMILLAFYLMIGYVLLGQWSRNLSVVDRLFGTCDTWLSPFRRVETDTPSYAANLAMRLLQVHVVIIVLVSAFHKLQFGTWWAGVAPWYRLYPPQELDAAKLNEMKPNANTSLFFISLATYLMFAWQFAFPFFAFRPRWRWLLVGGAVAGWIAVSFMHGMPYFGPVFMIFALSYLTADEWSRWFGRLRPSAEAVTTAARKPETRFRPRVKADANK
jgi:hypothetical protein